MQKPVRTLVSMTVAMLTASMVHAGGFSLYTESNGYAVGNYAAGIAAEAADASTGWYNPAGLVLLHHQQAILAGVGVFPVSKLTGTATYTTLSGIPYPFNVYPQSFSGINGAEDAGVPSFHYALPFSDRIAFGLSVVSPFGLSTEWSRTDPMRYQATFSELLTTDISPEISGLVTDNLSLGAGLDLQYTRVKFNSVIGVPTLSVVLGQIPAFLDSTSYNKGHAFDAGFHAGAIWMFNDHSRIGLNYQSRVNHTFHGYSRLHGPLASPGLDLTNPFSVITANPNTSVKTYSLSSNNIDFPEVITLSGYHEINDRWAVLGSVVYTGWHTVANIELKNVSAFVQGLGQRLVNSTSNENYDNAWRAAVGANYHVNEQWMLRVGGGYDQTPTNNIDRSVRLPDADRWALSIGAHYQMRPDIGFDAGYTHLFAVTDPTVNKFQYLGTTALTNVHATGDVRADLVGLQAVWTLDPVVPAPTK